MQEERLPIPRISPVILRSTSYEYRSKGGISSSKTPCVLLSADAAPLESGLNLVIKSTSVSIYKMSRDEASCLPMVSRSLGTVLKIRLGLK